MPRTLAFLNCLCPLPVKVQIDPIEAHARTHLMDIKKGRNYRKSDTKADKRSPFLIRTVRNVPKLVKIATTS